MTTPDSDTHRFLGCPAGVRISHPLPADPRVPSGAVVSGVGLEVGDGRAEREQKGWNSVSVMGGGDEGGSLEGSHLDCQILLKVKCFK